MDNRTGRVMPAGGSGSVAPAAAAAAAVGSLPSFSQAPSQQHFVPPPSQAPAQQQLVPPPSQAPSQQQLMPPHGQPSSPSVIVLDQTTSGSHTVRATTRAAHSTHKSSGLPAGRSQSLAVAMPPPPALLPPQQPMLPPTTPQPFRAPRTPSAPPSAATRRLALSSPAATTAGVARAGSATVRVGVKRESGAVAGPAEGTGKTRKGTGGIATAGARSSAGLAVGSTPIDVDLPPRRHTQGRLLVASEDQLADVVAAAAAPMRKEISLTRKDVKEMLSSMHEVRRTVDSQGQAIDRMVGGLTNVQSKMEEGAADVKNGSPSYKTASKEEPEHAAMRQKL